MSTSSTVSLNDINVELARTATASINMNEPEVRFLAGQTLSTHSSQTFTGTSTWTCPSNVTSIEYLIVAGGGGGGCGGGGGAGGMLRGRTSVTPGATYTMTIGGGGAIGYDGTNLLNQNGNGGNSSIVGTGVSITASGGGGGASPYYGTSGSGYRGGNGGSGGGGGCNAFADGQTLLGGTGIAGQGRNGGAGPGIGCSPSGGGGGAEYEGGTFVSAEISSDLKKGGNGKPTSISGSLVYYAGGGGGGSYCAGRGLGGLGGGGNGGTNGANGTTGQANRGGGGGGSGYPGVTARIGGSGIIIIRWFAASANSGTSVNMNSLRNLAPPYAGATYGFSMGGADPGSQRSSNIERIPFSSDASSTIVGYLGWNGQSATARGSNYGHNSETTAFTSMGLFNPPTSFLNNRTTTIESFPFSNTLYSTIIGDLEATRSRGAGASSRTNGYAMAGITLLNQPTPEHPEAGSSYVERFSFSSVSIQCIVGNLNNSMTGGNAGFGNLSHGFSSGGIRPPAPVIGGTATIDRFPFAFDGVSITNIGSLTVARGLTAGASSPTHGYTCGGLLVPATRYSTIDRFSFASTGNATSVGNLTGIIASLGATNSVSNGYTFGGATPSIVNTIQKFQFSSSSSSTNIGSLLSNRIQMATACD